MNLPRVPFMVEHRVVRLVPDADISAEERNVLWEQDVSSALKAVVDDKISVTEFLAIVNAASAPHGRLFEKLPDGADHGLRIRVSHSKA